MMDDLTPLHWNGDDIDSVIDRMQSHNDVPLSVIADVITALRAERDRILAILDAHPNASPGWLALQIREGKL